MRSQRIVLATKLALAIMAAASLLTCLAVRAQQPSGTADARKDVPENLADHTAPMQPIPYSHKTHLAIGLDCKTCHKNPEPGKLMTFPATTTCMSCHLTVAKEKPSIQKLAALAKSGQPIPWVRVYTVTEGVNWTHRKHLDAGIKCETCHGQVSELAAMSQVTAVTSMGVCINCHKLHSAPTVCQTCHAWPSS